MIYSNIKCSTIKKCYPQLIHCKVNPHETCRGNNPVNKFLFLLLQFRRLILALLFFTVMRCIVLTKYFVQFFLFNPI